MQKRFNEIALVAVKSRFKELQEIKYPQACPDQFVGEIAQICYLKDMFNPKDKARKTFTRENITEGSYIRDPKCSNVILILESPHVEEFKDGRQGPAQGVTGTNIRIYLKEVLDGLNIEYQGYGLILMNAIRFQCSLGMPTDYVRDEIFLKVWEAGGKSDFERRLNGIFRNGDVLVNCCTIGANKRDFVTHSISGISCSLGIKSLITGSHPSFWSIRRNRSQGKFARISLPI